MEKCLPWTSLKIVFSFKLHRSRAKMVWSKPRMAIRHEPHLTANLFEILPCHHQFKCLFLKPICFTHLQRVTLATLIYDIQSIEIYPFFFLTLYIISHSMDIVLHSKHFMWYRRKLSLVTYTTAEKEVGIVGRETPGTLQSRRCEFSISLQL